MDATYKWNWRTCTSLKKSPKAVEFPKMNLIDLVLQNGRRKGAKAFSKLVFPLVREPLRWAWIIGEVILVLVGLILSIATFTTGNNTLFTQIHLALTVIAAILVFVDAGVSLRPCKCHKTAEQIQVNNELNSNENENVNETPHDVSRKNHHDGQSKGNCSKCDCLKTTFDVSRAVLTELILSPLLVCDLFEVITGQGYNSEQSSDRLGFALFVIDCIGTSFFLYIARLMILAGAIKSIYRIHSQSTDDSDVRFKAFLFQIVFLVHTVGQMLGQLVMFVAVGAQIRYDNQHLYEPSDQTSFSTDTIHTSGPLVYMSIAVCFLPLFGMFTFFIYANFWVQEFPISLITDFMKLVQIPGATEILDYTKTVKDHSKVLSKITEKLQLSILNNKFADLHNNTLSVKILYPFRNPFLVVLCLVYGAFHLAFYICAGIGYNNTKDIVALHGSGWVLYYTIIGAFFDIAINFYVLIIAACWFFIILFYVLVHLLALLIFICTVCSIIDSLCKCEIPNELK